MFLSASVKPWFAVASSGQKATTARKGEAEVPARADSMSGCCTATSPKARQLCHHVAAQTRFCAAMKMLLNPQDLQLRDAIRKLLVRYIKHARQRLKKPKRKVRKTARLLLPSRSGDHGLFPRLRCNVVLGTEWEQARDVRKEICRRSKGACRGAHSRWFPPRVYSATPTRLEGRARRLPRCLCCGVDGYAGRYGHSR